jgi:hypothetical protein
MFVISLAVQTVNFTENKTLLNTFSNDVTQYIKKQIIPFCSSYKNSILFPQITVKRNI